MNAQSTPNMMDLEEVKILIRRQDELEQEIRRLKLSLEDLKDEKKQEIDRVNRRIDRLEDEVAEIRQAIEKIMYSMDMINLTVSGMSEKVGEINSKQDHAITTQEKFIDQLWKAFFAVLGLVTAGVTALIALMR